MQVEYKGDEAGQINVRHSWVTIKDDVLTVCQQRDAVGRSNIEEQCREGLGRQWPPVWTEFARMRVASRNWQDCPWYESSDEDRRLTELQSWGQTEDDWWRWPGLGRFYKKQCQGPTQATRIFRCCAQNPLRGLTKCQGKGYTGKKVISLWFCFH